MMRKFTGWIVDHAWLSLAVIVAITVVFLVFIPKLELQTDFGKYLPDSDRSVQLMRNAEKIFGSQEFFMVLVETPDTIFDVATIAEIHAMELEFADLREIDQVIGPTTATVISATGDRISVEKAAELLPTTPAEVEVYRQKVLGDRNLVGYIFAANERAAGIVLKPSPYLDDTAVLVAAVDEIAKAHDHEGFTVYVGGIAPAPLGDRRQHDARHARPDAARAPRHGAPRLPRVPHQARRRASVPPHDVHDDLDGRADGDGSRAAHGVLVLHAGHADRGEQGLRDLHGEPLLRGGPARRPAAAARDGRPDDAGHGEASGDGRLGRSDGIPVAPRGEPVAAADVRPVHRHRHRVHAPAQLRPSAGDPRALAAAEEAPRLRPRLAAERARAVRPTHLATAHRRARSCRPPCSSRSAMAIPRLVVDTSPTEYLGSDHAAMDAMHALDRNFGGSSQLSIHIVDRAHERAQGPRRC